MFKNYFQYRLTQLVSLPPYLSLSDVKINENPFSLDLSEGYIKLQVGPIRSSTSENFFMLKVKVSRQM